MIEWMDGLTDGQMGEEIDRYGSIEIDRQVDGWVDGLMDG
jgi:hypothetical protein